MIESDLVSGKGNFVQHATLIRSNDSERRMNTPSQTSEPKIDPNRVFIVTGFKGKTPEDAAREAHVCVANTDHDAVQAVIQRIPDFVPMGASTLAELKRFVIQMEAVRIGVTQPLNALPV